MIVEKKALLSELAWISRFIEKKTTIPILAMALFEVDGNTLSLTATDLETGAVTTVKGKGRKVWSVAAPVAKLINYLKKVDEDEVSLEVSENHWLTVTHGSDNSRIAGMSKESYPELPKPPEGKPLTLGHFSQAVSRVAFAISKEESRFTLNGALLEVDEDEARLVATDGHRLSLAPLQVKGNSKVRALIPKFALIEAGKMEIDPGFSMTMEPIDPEKPKEGERPAFLFFDFGQRSIVTRAMKGGFPDWQRVVPKEIPNHVMVPVKSMQKTLDRVALYADERSRCVRISVDGDTLTIHAVTIDTGEAKGSITVRPGEGGGPFEIGLNASYVLDFLRATECQFVAFGWTDEKNAATFIADGQWIYVCMPMRV